MEINIDQLTEDELVALNHRIIERLKFIDTMHAHREMMTFNLGSRVSFESNKGTQLGTVTKFNRKTVTVMTDSGQRWNISPHLLTKVKDAKSVQKFIYNNEQPVK